MLEVGVDLIEIDRIARALARHGDRFRHRFYTEGELIHCSDRVECLAGRFVIKEAVAKALGTGIGDVGWKEIEVVCNERGKPHLVLHGRAQELAAELGLHTWSVSLSHTATHAIGFAVAQGAHNG